MVTSAGSGGGRRLADALGRSGLWSNLDGLPVDRVLALASRVEASGYGSLWVNESAGREPFGLFGRIAAATTRLRLGTGVAQIYARDPLTTHAAASTLHEVSGGRFVLGLGVSHASSVEGLRGQAYRPPLAAMREYLGSYRAATYRGPLPHGEAPVVLAALRRRMLELAATETDGAFPYLVPADYLVGARATLDAAAAAAARPRPALIATLAVHLTDDPPAGRDAGRPYVARYLQLPNYVRNLAESGFDEDDLRGSGSDRLVDALVAHGSAEAVRARLRAMHDAGADHVLAIPLRSDGGMPAEDAIETLAPPW